MTPLTVEASVWLTILGAASVTYGLRVSGLLLASHFPKTGRFKRFMDALPGTILLSLIIPAALAEGAAGWIAALATAWCSWKTGNVFGSMVVGMMLVAAGRWLGI